MNFVERSAYRLKAQIFSLMVVDDKGSLCLTCKLVLSWPFRRNPGVTNFSDTPKHCFSSTHISSGTAYSFHVAFQSNVAYIQ